jgi:hypothetical protein
LRRRLSRTWSSMSSRPGSIVGVGAADGN